MNVPVPRATGTMAQMQAAAGSLLGVSAWVTVDQQRIDGFDRVRFLTPVAAGSRVRARFTLEKATPRAAGQVLFQYCVDVDIEGVDRPALAADWLMLAMFDDKENAK
jgi:acyl dehydratase